MRPSRSPPMSFASMVVRCFGPLTLRHLDRFEPIPKWATKTKRLARALMPGRGPLIKVACTHVASRSGSRQLSGRAAPRGSASRTLGRFEAWRHVTRPGGCLRLGQKAGTDVDGKRPGRLNLRRLAFRAGACVTQTKYFRPLAASTGARIPIEFVTHRTFNL
jgi:hypothetical protein